jgi:hypothetical protein
MEDKFTIECLKTVKQRNLSELVMTCDAFQELPEFCLNLQEVKKNLFQSRP